MNKITAIFGSFYGLSAIVLGAFASHGLKKILVPEKLVSFEVGVRYQMYAAFFLLLMGFFLKFETSLEKYISIFMILGCFLFSFTIYLLSMQNYLGMDLKFLGPITPIGGALMILSWALLLVYWLKK